MPLINIIQFVGYWANLFSKFLTMQNSRPYYFITYTGAKPLGTQVGKQLKKLTSQNART